MSLKEFVYYYLSPGARKRREIRNLKRDMCDRIMKEHLCTCECYKCSWSENENFSRQEMRENEERTKLLF